MGSPTAIAGDAAERAFEEHVRAERVRFVFIQSALPIIFSPVAAAILSFTLWNVVDRRLLAIWTTVLVVIAAARMILVRRFARSNVSGDAVQRWERVFVVSIILVDVCWGIGAIFLLPPGLTERALVFSFVMLMAGGHTASYSAHPTTVVIGVLALTVPITVVFLLQADVFHFVLAFVAIMYLAASFRSINTLSFFFSRSYRLAHELQKEKERVEELARTDFLSALLNRRAFFEAGEQVVAAPDGHPHAVLMVDIDHFKSINDRFGHAAGDDVIRAVADLVREHLRADDFAGRVGGEEFAVLLPRTTLDDACAIAERMRASAETAVRVTPCTISVGVATSQAATSVSTLLDLSDRALYGAKRAGRNRVCIAEADCIRSGVSAH